MLLPKEINYKFFINSYRCIINSFTIFLNFSIRENIVDEFTCDGRSYGYYADVANDCQVNLGNLAHFREMAINFSSQLFHICYPVAYPDGQEEMFKWSFICPNQTIFDQVNFQIFAIAQTRPSLTRLAIRLAKNQPILDDVAL